MTDNKKLLEYLKFLDFYQRSINHRLEKLQEDWKVAKKNVDLGEMYSLRIMKKSLMEKKEWIENEKINPNVDRLSVNNPQNINHHQQQHTYLNDNKQPQQRRPSNQSRPQSQSQSQPRPLQYPHLSSEQYQSFSQDPQDFFRRNLSHN